MIDLGQCDSTIYKLPQQSFKFYLVREATGDIVATFDKRPRPQELENKCPNFWDGDYKLIKKEV